MKLNFLGFLLHAMKRGEAGIQIHRKSIDSFKQRICELTRRNQGRSIEDVLQKLRQYTTGWLNYYSIADMKSFIQNFTELLRRKIRTYVWKQWKRIRTRFVNLQHLGVDQGKTWEWANTRKGYWRIAGSYIMSRTLTNKRIAQMGYDDIAIRYNALHLNY